MIDPKPYGAFMEHTVRPMLEECENLLRGMSVLDLKKGEIYAGLRKLALLHALTQIIDLLKTVLSLAIIGYIVCTISR